MEDTQSATRVASAPDGGERREFAANGSRTSAPEQDGEQQDRPASLSPTRGGGKGDTVEEKGTTHLLPSERGSSGKAKTSPSANGNVETPLDFSPRSPPVAPSVPAATPARQEVATKEIPPLAGGGSVTPSGGSASVEAPASPGVPDEEEKSTLAASLSRSLTGARTPPHTASSPAPSASKGSYRDATGEAPAGKNAADQGGSVNKLRLSFVPMPQDERPHPYSPPSSATAREDIIEFVVRRPTGGGAAVPYFSAENNGRTSCVPAEPLFRRAPSMDTEGYVCVPGRGAMRTENYFQLQQQQLQEQHQQQEQLLQEKQSNMYISATPGGFVLLPQPKWEINRNMEGDYSVGKRFPSYPPCAPISFPQWKAAAPGPFYPEFGAPSYSARPARISERDITRGVPSFALYPRNIPLEMRWKVQEHGPHLFTDDASLGVIQRRGSGTPLFFAQATPRRTEIGNKVVVPDAKRLLCFGHAGDERKFCFGLLQLPPPTLKYDFLIEKKAAYCGMCQNVKYVAVCRKCRMRLPTCPYCDRQSAIRHP